MRKQEKFRSALAVSFMLHLLLLWPAVSLHRQEVTGESLSVVLMPVPDKAQNPAGGSLHPASRGLRELHSATADKNTVSRQKADIQSSTSPLGNTPASTTEIPTRSESPSAGLAVAGREAQQQASAGAQGLDADGVRQYRMALAVEARRFKRYPQRALTEEIGGTVEVRIAVAAGGQAQEVALARSSGSEALDDAALDMLRKAAPRTMVPELLRRRSFVVNLPVVFDVASE